MKCKVEDCDKKHHAKGYCKIHYCRLRRNGSVEETITNIWPKDMPHEVWFWNMIDIRSEDECWVWLGSSSGGGYGQSQDKIKKAHRQSWVYTNGDIPDGMDVCHECDNPPCCNPNHLFLGTHQDNMVDRTRKGRSRNGHTGPLLSKI